ncbi:aldo/keto reductase [Halobacterium wangiae]|uniref:aldo/keto reductase n=1 Tax=Halobacterium wangiae TaxID=2902623 RepID=UPI001E59B27A|nr:aldo/keto reductase [Halobacterium wangiae]
MAALPPLGFGTFKLHGEECTRAVENALDVGYRHVDTAQFYENEAAVGDGLERSDVPREEVSVATKLWHDSLDSESVHEGVRESRERLGVDTIDLVYVHWPANTYDPEETLGALSECYDDGLLDAVGLSNFTAELVDEALDVCDAPVEAVQLERHPLLPQTGLCAHCAGRDLDVLAYNPLMHGFALDRPEVEAVAARHDVSPARALLAWHQAAGVTPVPKASSPEHVRDNYASLDLELDGADLARIDGIEERRRLGDPEFAPW